MNLIKKCVALTAFTLASGSALAFDSFETIKEAPGKGVALASCAIGEEYGRSFQELKLIDRSSEEIPAPRKGANCSQYIADLDKLGANVEVNTVPCEAILPGTDRYKLCLFVIATQVPIW